MNLHAVGDGLKVPHFLLLALVQTILLRDIRRETRKRGDTVSAPRRLEKGEREKRACDRERERERALAHEIRAQPNRSHELTIVLIRVGESAQRDETTLSMSSKRAGEAGELAVSPWRQRTSGSARSSPPPCSTRSCSLIPKN